MLSSPARSAALRSVVTSQSRRGLSAVATRVLVDQAFCGGTSCDVRVMTMCHDASKVGSVSSSSLRPSHQDLHASGNRWFSSSAAAVTDDDESEEAGEQDDATTTAFVPTPDRKYQYFQNVEFTPQGVAIIRFDNPDKKYNTVNKFLRDEAMTLWNDEIHNNSDVRAVVFTSGKPDGFIAGADIFDIQSVENKEELIPFIEEWLNFFQHMKSKGVPMVCAINGPALGGGLEWALWCDYRICTDSSTTKLGLPEVKLGLLPGFGGTQNLFPLVGLQGAMDMMLTGKDIRPPKAKKMGLVDMVVAPASLETVAINTALGLAEGTVKKSTPKKKSLMNRFIEDTSIGRNMMWKKVEEMVEKNTNGNYPAPGAIIECVS